MDFVYRHTSQATQERRFNRFLVKVLPDLYRLAMALCHHAEDAEDLVNDACVKALGAFKDAYLPTSAARRAWVRKILINLHRDRYRRETRSPVQSRTDNEDNNVVEFAMSTEPSPEEWAVYSDLSLATRNAMYSLPPEVRAVVALYMVDERKYKEIAEILGCPIGTVMSRLARGRRLLRTSLGKHLVSHSDGKARSKSVSIDTEYASE